MLRACLVLAAAGSAVGAAVKAGNTYLELWGVDQAASRNWTNASGDVLGGGVFYGTTPGEGFGTWHFVQDVAADAAMFGRPLPTREHLVTPGDFTCHVGSTYKPHIIQPIEGKDGVAHHVLVSTDRGLAVYQLPERRLVACVVCKNTHTSRQFTIGVVHGIATREEEDHEYIWVNLISERASESGAVCRLHADWDKNEFTQTHFLDAHTLVDRVGGNTARPFWSAWHKGYLYVSMVAGGNLILNPDNLHVEHVYHMTEVQGYGMGSASLVQGVFVTGGYQTAEEVNVLNFIPTPRSTCCGEPYDNQTVQHLAYRAPTRCIDLHSLLVCNDEDGLPWLWTFCRLSGDLVIVDPRTFSIVKNRSFGSDEGGEAHEPLVVAADIFTDFVDDMTYLALRGIQPWSAIIGYPDPRRVPGIGRIRRDKNCLDGKWVDFKPTVNGITAQTSDVHSVGLIRLAVDTCPGRRGDAGMATNVFAGAITGALIAALVTGFICHHRTSSIRRQTLLDSGMEESAYQDGSRISDNM